MEEKRINNCFWLSREGYCTEGGRPPHKCQEVCDKHKPMSQKDNSRQ